MKTSFANSAIHSLRFLTVVSLFVLGGLVSRVSADPVSISINFGPHFGAPTGGDLGVVPVNWQNWNNAISDAGVGLNQYTASGADQNHYNMAGTINNQIDNPEFFTSNLISNTGEDTGVTATWSCNNTYRYSGTRPSTDNNAILYYGYLDDSSAAQRFNMESPFFSYDIYYYATTDGNGFRYATINSVNYTGNGTSTVVGTSNWGTPVRGDLSTLTEGVNYLRVSSSDPSIAISGVAIDSSSSKRRGSFGAVQIVNTANSQSLTTAGNSLVLANATWNNDLTGATGESFNASADGYRILYTGTEETFTVDLSGATTSLPNIKLIGTATNLVFTGTISQLGQTDAVTDLTSIGSLELPGIGKIAPRGVVKFAPGVSVTSVTEQASIPGAYLVDGTTVSLAKISGGQIVAIEPTTASTPTDGMDLKVTSVVTDNAIRTLNSLTSTHDYKNNKALTITSGMMMFNNRNHWVQGGGTITSGYQNADGEYDLYLCAVGTADDMRIDSSGIVDNPSGKLNLIKTGTGIVGITNSTGKTTYTGKTVVLEGKIFFGAQIVSSQFYVAKEGTLDFSCRSLRGDSYLNYGDIDFTATELTGTGTVIVGNSSTVGSLTLNNVTNDGSKFTRVNAHGKALTLNSSELHTAVLDSKTVITLNSSSIVADTFTSSANSTVKFDATSTLSSSAIVTSAGALTMEIPSGRTLEISTPITGAGGLVKDGAGKMTLKAKNTFTGGTTVNAGTLELTISGGTGALAPGKAVTVVGETSVLAGHDDFLGYTSGAIGRLTLQNGGTLYNDKSGTHTTVNNVIYMENGVISANGNGTPAGTGGAGSYNFLLDNAIHVTGGTNNQITANGIWLRSLNNTPFETGDFAGLIDVAEGAKLTISSVIGYVASNDSGVTANMTKAGAGELVLTGKSPFNKNITVNGGVLDLTQGAVYTGAYVSGANVNVNTGGTLKINNFGYNEAGNSSLGGLTYSSNGSTNIHFNGGTIQIAESFGETINRKIELQENGGTLDLAQGVELVLGANIHGAGGLTKAGAGTLELTYANEYTGGTAVSGGYLKLTNDAVRDNGSMTVAEGATLEYALAGDQPTPTLAFDTNKKFASAGAVLKTGAGALKINAAENCFDATTLTVKEGRLDMKSYLTGRLEINNGATFSPGNSIGKLNVTGSVALGQAGVDGDAAQVIMELGGSSRDQNDELVVTGDLELNNAQIILEMAEGSGLYPGESFTAVFSSGNSGSYASNFIDRYVQAPYYLLDLSYTEISPGTYAITGRLDGNALPEPSAWALLLLGAFGLLYARKQKRG